MTSHRYRLWKLDHFYGLDNFDIQEKLSEKKKLIYAVTKIMLKMEAV